MYMDKGLRSAGTGIKHAFRAAGKTMDKATKAATQAQNEMQTLGSSVHGDSKCERAQTTLLTCLADACCWSFFTCGFMMLR